MNGERFTAKIFSFYYLSNVSRAAATISLASASGTEGDSAASPPFGTCFCGVFVPALRENGLTSNLSISLCSETGMTPSQSLIPPPGLVTRYMRKFCKENKFKLPQHFMEDGTQISNPNDEYL